MCRNIKFKTIPISTLNHSFSFTPHFNYSETILMQWACLVSYTLDLITFRYFGSHSRTAVLYITLISICALFDFKTYCVMHVGMSLIPLLVTPQLSTFFSWFYAALKRRMICRDYTLSIDGVCPPHYQKEPPL